MKTNRRMFFTTVAATPMAAQVAQAASTALPLSEVAADYPLNLVEPLLQQWRKDTELGWWGVEKPNDRAVFKITLHYGMSRSYTILIDQEWLTNASTEEARASLIRQVKGAIDCLAPNNNDGILW